MREREKKALWRRLFVRAYLTRVGSIEDPPSQGEQRSSGYGPIKRLTCVLCVPGDSARNPSCAQRRQESQEKKQKKSCLRTQQN
jgi:hypothetical protein